MRTLLFAPSPEHAESILREGPCCAMPPTMIHGVPTGETEARWYTTIDNDHPWHNGKPKALVLVHEGAIVPEGMDRLARVLGPVLYASGDVADGEAPGCTWWAAEPYESIDGGTVSASVCVSFGYRFWSRSAGQEPGEERALTESEIALVLAEFAAAYGLGALTTTASARRLGVSVSL